MQSWRCKRSSFETCRMWERRRCKLSKLNEPPGTIRHVLLTVFFFTVSNTAIEFSRQICDQETRLLGFGKLKMYGNSGSSVAQYWFDFHKAARLKYVVMIGRKFSLFHDTTMAARGLIKFCRVLGQPRKIPFRKIIFDNPFCIIPGTMLV